MTVLNANQLPASTGLDLGSDSQRWDVYAQNLSASGLASTVAFSSTPTFSATQLINIFKMTLTGNVTSSTLTVSQPCLILFEITQDAIGARTFAWPSTVNGAINIGGAAGQVTVQALLYDGASVYPVAPGVYYP